MNVQNSWNSRLVEFLEFGDSELKDSSYSSSRQQSLLLSAVTAADCVMSRAD